MIDLTAQQIAEVVGGTLVGDPAVIVTGSVVTDSRLAEPGSLYVARIGEQADGHDFVPAARENGAVLSLTQREVPGNHVVVDDVQDAFAGLARWLVDEVEGLDVVAVTGSSGKTSTKDLLGQVLGAVAPTVAPIESYNSEVGVPLTVCRIDRDTRYLVAEMGASGPGHIAYLTAIAPPRVGIVLNVGSAHLGGFGSQQGIADTKAAIVEDLPADGLAVLNADDPLVSAMAERVHSGEVSFFSLDTERGRTDERVHAWAEELRLDESGRARFTAALRDPQHPGAEERHAVALQVRGAHMAGNALAVLLAARHVGVAPAQAVAALAEATALSRWRMEVTQRADDVTVVNDGYNANPESMRAALEAVRDMAHGRRTWAVLGGMLELGPESAAHHAAVGRHAVATGTDVVLVVGEVAAPIADGVREATAEAGQDGPELLTAKDSEEARTMLNERLRPGDVVLFKSSRDSGMRVLGDLVAGMMP
ncbi:UDP-N-acetylmuramoyl-tripeptide--D-alanyl-D-alanine ligase [Kytococcus aerolatus]|uniref:UDP-N-acetylmuramoyl-tripeptide--D-alanyl-D-alanine ligase n=1 Tax=Kytococcus aerolatus TaxID=592308 RepID=A0A212T506_9MICO|nr:UDP-N-acetylmuramoyl-tripeptide--D-alanyl-D-alanine ligase [Kytococcus aerolatus]SNC60950.1 UDP-N-acetylmuramoyl-tripeptide--D-alanyl-D-alanine ligase [Kytococcus aerolatus]